MYEIIFLLALAFVYLFFAVIQDIRTREIANWISFSLIIFALGFRFFYSLFLGEDFSFFYQGIIGLGIFFVLGNLFYYSRIFAGGDAKLIIALGTVLPFSLQFLSNVAIFLNFFIIFLFVGFVYIFLTSIVLGIKNFGNFKKEFLKQLKSKKKLMSVIVSLSIIFLILGFVETSFFAFGILTFLIFYLYLYSKAVDESCMIKKIKTKNLREGDWLYSDVRVRKHLIKATWDGLTKKDIREISKKYKEVKIRQGVPFSPVILISFIVSIIFYFVNVKLWNPLW